MRASQLEYYDGAFVSHTFRNFEEMASHFQSVELDWSHCNSNSINDLLLSMPARTALHTRYLHLAHCGLTDLPEKLFLFRNLRGLDVSHNQLVALPHDLCDRLPHLKLLNLAHNSLTVLHLPGLRN
jgi:Leucine-rich repeat (LRR) protein